MSELVTDAIILEPRAPPNERGERAEIRLARILERIQDSEPFERVEAPGPISVDIHQCAGLWVDGDVHLVHLFRVFTRETRSLYLLSLTLPAALPPGLGAPFPPLDESPHANTIVERFRRHLPLAFSSETEIAWISARQSEHLRDTHGAILALTERSLSDVLADDTPSK